MIRKERRAFLQPRYGRRPRGDANLLLKGTYKVECFGPDGQLKWEAMAENSVTNSALDNVLDVYLRDQSQTATWYISLVDNAGFTSFAAGDTMASHAGWAESVAYSNANRLAWSPGASSGQSVTNGTSVDFSINASAVIRGLFLTSANDKGGNTGKLFSTANFSGGNQTVGNGDTLKVTYTVSAAAA